MGKNYQKYDICQNELNEFFNLTLGLLCIADVEGNFLKVNKAWKDFLGYTADELEGSNFFDLIHPEDINRTLEAIESLKGQKRVLDFINRYKTKDNKYRYLEWRAQPKGNLIYASARDITEQLDLSQRLVESEIMQKNVLNTIPTRIFWKDKDLKYLGCNSKFAKDAGLESTKDIIGKTDDQMVWSEFAENFNRDDIQVIEEGKSKLDYEEQVSDSNGTIRWVKTSKIPLYNSDNKVFGVLGMFEDITEKKKSEEKLIESQERFEQLAKISRAITFELDSNGQYTYMSPVFQEVCGYAPQEIVGKKQFFDLHFEDEREELKNCGVSIIKNKKNLQDFEHKVRHRDGREIWFLTNGFSILDDKGNFQAFKGMSIDITYRKQTEKEIEYISFHDHLTGLYNRRFFEKSLNELDSCNNLPLSIVMIDSNGLKLLNDTFGHESGDLLLKKIASILKKVTRTGDIAARVGGDEFILLLPKTEPAYVKKIINRIEKSLNNYRINGVQITVSIGWNTKKVKYQPIEDTLKIAETYMYKNKSTTKKQVRNQGITSIINKLFMSYPYGEEHSLQVSQWSESLGRALGLTHIELEKIKKSALYHDIGKISVKEEILKKKDPLNKGDLNDFRRHPEVGYMILTSSNDFSQFAEDVLYHHENYDGTGYPKGLYGDQIPLNSRIIAVANAYYKMTERSSHKGPMSLEKVTEALKREAGKKFDPTVVDTFINEVLPKTNNK